MWEQPYRVGSVDISCWLVRADHHHYCCNNRLERYRKQKFICTCLKGMNSFLLISPFSYIQNLVPGDILKNIIIPMLPFEFNRVVGSYWDDESHPRGHKECSPEQNCLID